MTPEELAAFDREVQLQLDLLRHSASVEGKTLRLLETMRKQLIGKLAGEKLTTFGKARLNALLKDASGLIDATYKRIAEDLSRSMESVSELVAKPVPLAVGLSVAAPSPSVLGALIKNTLIEGAPSAQWWSRQSMDTAFRFANAVRQGIAQGETNDQIFRKVGQVTDLAGRNSRALVQTAIMQVAGDARMALIDANTDIYAGYRHLSTLDGHTTPQCIARSGLVWNLDKEPVGHSMAFKQPPIHWGCRSVMLGVLKSFKELGINLPEPQGLTRASAEGQIDRSTTFDAFLGRRSVAEQDAQLGAGRAQMWRDGKITLRQLVDNAGNPLTLEQLRGKYE